jgi:hypothetical protein
VAVESDFAVLEKLLRPLSHRFGEELARALIEVEPDHEVQERYDDLAAKNSEGLLSSEERLELEGLVRANSLLQVLKLEARLALEKAAA